MKQIVGSFVLGGSLIGLLTFFRVSIREVQREYRLHRHIARRRNQIAFLDRTIETSEGFRRQFESRS